MTTSFRIKIIPAVKTAYVGGFANFGIYARISWPYVAIILLLPSLERYYFLSPFVDEFLPRLPRFVWIFLRQLSEAIFVVGFYRFLLLKDTEHLRTISIKRGIEKARNLLAFPVYFRFGMREILASSIGLAYIGLKILNSKLLIYILYTTEGESQITYYPNLFSVMQYFNSFVFFPLLAAALIFLWPYLASAEKFNIRAALRVIVAIKGNIIRVAIVSFLIYLPAYFFKGFVLNLWFWFEMYILDNSTYSELLRWFLTGWPYSLFSSLSMLLKYGCLAAEIYFVQFIYKQIVLEECAGTEIASQV